MSDAAPATILVVDDSAMNRQLVIEQLAARGYAFSEASGGAEALEAIAARRFDAVILDVMMPGIDGYEVLQRVRERYSLSELPVIIATARDDRADIVTALRLGANDYVTKPLDFAVVFARLGTHLALKRATDEVRRLNQQFARAQAEIARLTETASDALRDVAAWTSATASELAPIVGAQSISVWLLEGIELWSLHESDVPRPRLEELAIASEKKSLVRGDDTVLPVTGLSGDVFGALVVAGKTQWDEPEQRLMASFARELGSALEVQRMRSELAAAQNRVQLRRQEMIDRGIDILSVCPKCGLCYGHNRKRCGVDGARLESPRLLPLTIRNRYRLMRNITSGGMAKLFEAADEKLGRAVAVKLIKPEHFNDPEMRVRFEQEARAVARIDHPGVVSIYDSGELEDGTLFFIMELLRGLNLGQVLQRHGRGTPKQVAALVRQTGAALAAAHRAGFIHRDIKPENLFLTDDEGALRAKLLDFGIAKPIDVDSNLTQTGAFIGTPGYMAPEQLLGMAVDVRTDIYSLGAVAFEALTGERVVSSSAGTRIDPNLLRNPPSVRDFVDVPTEVEASIRSALAFDASARPADVETWSRQLADALDALPNNTDGWPHPLVAVPPPLDAAQHATMPSKR